jgi:pimeloyl-ACP methyl ester carboxylesterase
MRGLAEQLGLEKPVVLGHSWGTLVANAMALDTAADLGGLVLLSGYYFPTARADAVLVSGPAVPVMGDIMRYTVSPPLGRAMFPLLERRIFAPRTVPGRFRNRFPRDLALRPSQIRASAADSALMVPGAAAMAKHYGEIDVPVAILAGADDQIVSTARQAVRLHETIPGSTLDVLPGLGHMIHYAAQGRITQAVERILAG